MKNKNNFKKKSKNLKILMVSTEVPYITSGAPVRNYNLLKEIIKNKKNKVHLISFFDKFSQKYIAKLKRELQVKLFLIKKPKEYGIFKKIKKILNKKLPHPEMLRESTLKKRILNLKIKPDIIQLEELNSFFFMEGVLNRFDKSKIILDAHNVDYIKFKSELENMNLLQKSIGSLTLSNFKNDEIKALKQVDHIFTCSEIDKKYFSHYVPRKKITTISNGVDSNYFKSKGFVKEPIIIFVGLLSYLPNRDALNFYFNEIHPRVKAEIKNAKICIIGKNPPNWLKKLSKRDKSIILTGFVEDVRDYIKNARVCICPLRYGSGTRLKILEYMSMGKPVVSTSKGAEGLNAVNNKEIMIANNRHTFSNKVIMLLKNDEMSKKIGKNARKLIKRKYDWSIINKKVNSVYAKLISEEGKTK